MKVKEEIVVNKVIKEKYHFHAGIGYENAYRDEYVEIEFEGNKTGKEKEEIVQEKFDNWLTNFVDFVWSKVE